VIEQEPAASTLVARRWVAALAAMVSVAAVSAPFVICLYVLVAAEGSAAAAHYAAAIFAAAPLTVLSGLGLRTFLLTRTGPDAARAFAMRMVTAPLVVVGTGLWLWWASGAAAIVTGLAVGAVRATDNANELWVVQRTLHGEPRRVITACVGRAGVLTIAGLAGIALGARSSTLALAQVVAALAWFAFHDRPRLGEPARMSRALASDAARLVPMGIAGVAAIAAFALPRAIASGVLDDAQVGHLAAITTLPLLVGTALTALVDMVFGPRAAHHAVASWVVPAGAVAVVGLAAAAVGLASAGDSTAVGVALMTVAVCFSALTAMFTVVAHVRRRLRPVVVARAAGALAAAVPAAWAARRYGINGVVLVMAVAQGLGAAMLAVACARPARGVM
jgi:hypothetical protein